MTDKMADRIPEKEMELYFHIPFCVRKCLYCDFLSAPADRETIGAYMEAMIRETEARAGDYGGYTVVSVFMGGGTPSLVETGQLERLLETVRQRFRLQEGAEITIEVNPGTADGEKLARYRRAGINRLSIGLQSADDEELARLGRIHDFRQFLETYGGARAAGFSNINVDIMSALPEQTLSDYTRTLQAVLSLKPLPEHISAYSLIVEEGTLFYDRERAGTLHLPDEECDRLMYERTGELLEEAGYRRYEISNYALPGYECRHNCGYWQRREYLGLGLGASSLMGNCRFKNADSLDAYLKNPVGVREDIRKLTRRERMEEFMFLGLRMTEGISPAAFQAAFGRTLEEVYGSVIEGNIKNGLLAYHEVTGKDKAYLALTDRGLDLSNYVMAQFLL